MYILRVVLALALSILVTPFVMVTGLVARETAISITVWYFKSLMTIFGVTVKPDLIGFEDQPEGAVFPILNHGSLLDPLFTPIVGERPFRGVLNFEFIAVPFLGWFSYFLAFVIVRQRPKRAQKTLNKAVQFLKDGGRLCSTIEGKRSKDGSLSEYKKGPVVLAIKAQAPIVPLIMIGSREVLPYGSARIRPGEVVVRMLEPIPTSGFTYDDRDLIVKRLEMIAKMELGMVEKRTLEPLIPQKLSTTTIPERVNGNGTVSIPDPLVTKSN